MTFTSIPILDLSQADDPETKPVFLEELRHALMEVGFLYLRNVGIPDELFARVIQQGKAFFELPMEEKYVGAARIPSSGADCSLSCRVPALGFGSR